MLGAVRPKLPELPYLHGLNMKTTTRRSFLKASLLTAGAAGLSEHWTAWAATSSGRTIGANDEIGVAVVGFHGRGEDHLKSVRDLQKAGKKVRLVALCDPDKDILDRGLTVSRDKNEEVQGYTDIRKLLEDPKVDVVSIATPNHWHALATIWSVQAGKDVYVEKPVSHNISEGRRMVEAARKFHRIVQTGTQCRSSSGIREAVAWVRAGNLGKILVARGLCYKRRPSIGKVDGPQPVPPSVDYDVWCGPAPKGPLMRKRLHYDWHWVWPTGNGDVGNQGIHQMDIARWFLGEMALAPRVVSVDGRLGYVDDGTTPNTQIVFHDYPKAPLIFEVRGLPTKTGTEELDKFMGAGVGVIIHCEGGHVLVPNYSSATVFDKEGKEIRKFEGASDHHLNFFEAVRSRDYKSLNADILEGHISSALCHAGNISYRLGQQKSPDEIREAIKGERDGEASYQRMLDHLGANGVDLKATPATLGMALALDPKSERFKGNKNADRFLTREYREPFVVPAKV